MRLQLESNRGNAASGVSWWKEYELEMKMSHAALFCSLCRWDKPSGTGGIRKQWFKEHQTMLKIARHVASNVKATTYHLLTSAAKKLKMQIMPSPAAA